MEATRETIMRCWLSTETPLTKKIKRRFCKAAKTCHPDLNPGDKAAEQKFKEVNEAYSVLSDKEKKQRYDQFGHAGVDPSYGAGGPGAGGYGQYGGGDFGDIFGDIFGDMFGGGRARRANPTRPVKGRRYHHFAEY